MQRRLQISTFVIPAFAGGCTPPNNPSSPPSAGAATSDTAYPALGAKWRTRIAERDLPRETATEQEVTAMPIDFNGRPGYGLASPTRIVVLVSATFDTMGTIENGMIAAVSTPESGPFSWPLWVGKSCDAAYPYTDFVCGRQWPVAKSLARVAALEDVTVPAGTFKAFRIEYRQA